MKSKLFLYGLMFTGVFYMTSCEDDESDETCAADEICNEQSVTTCCTDDVCVWQYNGRDYTEDELGQLAIDLGCTTATVIDQLHAMAISAQSRL